MKAFDRRYPAGTRLEIEISNSAYLTQIKTVTVRRDAAPQIATRCQAPGSSKRVRC
jgi:hypothetical protein